MSSREDILQNVRRAIHVQYEKPDLNEVENIAMKFDDKVAKFVEVMKTTGGNTVVLKEGEDVNKVIRDMYPDLRRIASNLSEITCATFNPDDVSGPAELDGTDLAVVKGTVGVAETAAVWLKQDMKERAVYFISERLIILLDKTKLVNNMHEGYKLIDTGDYGFGLFMSGPSKTADIEQAMVFGAHGPREVTVILYSLIKKRN